VVEMRELISDLVERLREPISFESKVVVMPHFCLDNLIDFQGGNQAFIGSFQDIVAQGGGNISVSQSIQVGGKAANCVNALAALGIKPYLIARTNDLGQIFLKHFFGEKNVDISHVKGDGELALTSSIELDEANVMISDPGSLSEFGPEYLTQDDEDLLRYADIVMISDWGLNNKGTELAKHVFQLVRNKGKGKTFFDPGDPSPKGKEIDKEIMKLISEVIGQGLVDAISLNSGETEKFQGIDYLRTVARVDLHTKDYSRSFFGFRDIEKIPAFDVKPLRLTGAGDAWNAGNIFGEILGLSDELRLLLANSVAAIYISGSTGKHPSISKLIEFLEDQ
jgi:sugar/nucleoside kinase (ribokinase family)